MDDMANNIACYVLMESNGLEADLVVAANRPILRRG